MACAYTHRIPPELHLLVQDNLDRTALAALARTSKALRALCVPALFRTVSLPSLAALLAFLAHVPPVYRTHIRALDISTRAHASPSHPFESDPLTPRTDALAALLASTPRLERLALRLERGLAPHILPSFAALPRLAHLDIASLDDEADVPLSERLVVAIAKSLPALTHLSLTRITRSLSAAPDLLCPPSPLPPFALPAYPDLPLVANDLPLSPTDADADADDLALPALLALPLHHLAILDTHLGHPAWAAVPSAPAPGIPGTSAPSAAHGAPAPASSSLSTAAQRTLTSLDIGAHPDLPPAHNQALAAALLFRRAPASPSSPSPFASPWPSLRTLRLHAGLPSPPDSPDSPSALSPAADAHPHPRLPALSALRLSALVPPSALAPTLHALGAARAPLRALEACVLREDVGEACVALGEWVRGRAGVLGAGGREEERGADEDEDEDEVDEVDDGGDDGDDGAARWLPRLRVMRVRVVAAVEGDVEAADADGEADGEAVVEEEDAMDAETRDAVRVLLACCAEAGIEVRVEGVGVGVGVGGGAGVVGALAKEAGEAPRVGGEKVCGP